MQTDSTSGAAPAQAPEDAAVNSSLRRYLARSEEPIPRIIRWIYRFPDRVHLPAPRLVVKPILWTFLRIRRFYYFVFRVAICEPFFKAYCHKYGKGLRTGVFIHWVQGKGDLILGDNVLIDGKCSIRFAARFANRPRLEIGDNTGIGHNCAFVVGKRIQIGKNCLLSGDIRIVDSNGHPADVRRRVAQQPPSDEEIREVSIGDGVWIGVRVLVFPGVKIGDGAVISAGSVVHGHVPPYAVVAGNPARVVFRMKPPT